MNHEHHVIDCELGHIRGGAPEESAEIVRKIKAIFDALAKIEATR